MSTRFSAVADRTLVEEVAAAIHEYNPVQWVPWDRMDGEYRETRFGQAQAALRVAETRLRQLSADIRADQWPTSGERLAAAAAVNHAADMLAEGIDHG